MNLGDRLSVLMLWARNPGAIYYAWRQERQGLPRRRQRLADLLEQPVDPEAPTRYGELLLRRILYDRDPILVDWSDKLRMRDHIRRIVGPETAEAHLPKLVWSGTNAADIPFDRIDRPVVIKPNNSTAKVLRWDPATSENRDEVIATCRAWLRELSGVSGFSWIYWRIPPRLIVEEHIASGDLAPVDEYKFFVVGGQIVYGVISRRATSQWSTFDRDFNRLNVTMGGIKNIKSPIPEMDKPAFWDEICDHAIALTDGRSMLRVDYLVAHGRYWFGELTPFSSGSRERIDPESFDRHVAELWIAHETRRHG
jgi:hypothetical protein